MYNDVHIDDQLKFSNHVESALCNCQKMCYIVAQSWYKFTCRAMHENWIKTFNLQCLSSL